MKQQVVLFGFLKLKISSDARVMDSKRSALIQLQNLRLFGLLFFGTASIAHRKPTS